MDKTSEKILEVINKKLDTLQENQDLLSKQVREDRHDIDQIRIDQAKIATQGKIIIENQNLAEEKVVEAVKIETNKIPKKIETSINDMFATKSFLKKIKDKFTYGKSNL